jgi:hypothetical protein
MLAQASKAIARPLEQSANEIASGVSGASGAREGDDGQEEQVSLPTSHEIPFSWSGPFPPD